MRAQHKSVHNAHIGALSNPSMFILGGGGRYLQILGFCGVVGFHEILLYHIMYRNMR